MFEPFPKVPRLKRGCVVTEKIDGTNAQVMVIQPDELNKLFIKAFASESPTPTASVSVDGEDFLLYAGSRNRWVTPGKSTDNHGFAQWVFDNALDLVDLGPGRHYGEWWGQGIQRRYGLDHKRFSLFNTGRWNDDNHPPGCCHVVPTLYSGDFNMEDIDDCMFSLDIGGSVAAPGFMKPEGVMIFHSASRQTFKYTLGGDGHKG